MTIEEFVLDFETKADIDQLYVRDAKGNYVKVPGNTNFTNVSITYWDGCFADLEFTI